MNTTMLARAAGSDERPLLYREVPLEITQEGDGRTIVARVVPYGVRARVADPPDWVPYDEEFAAGAFNDQLAAANRLKVWLNVEHEQGWAGVIGRAGEFDDRPDGLYASFLVRKGDAGDKALEYVNDGTLTGLSIEFKSKKSRTVDGVVQRVRAHLDKVSLCRLGAYESAQVLAVREPADPEPDPDEDGVRVAKLPPLPDDKIASLERLGLRVDTLKHDHDNTATDEPAATGGGEE